MPHRPKKKFIDKKSSVTFQLVHRSQRDPLAADDEAPQHVLVPVSEDAAEYNFEEETPQQREERLSTQRTFGIGFDDDYDYMQHLREPDRQTAILIPKDPRLGDEELSEDQFADILNSAAKDKENAIKIPSVVFASKEEEDVGLLHRAIPPVGPQVEWDPDVVAAMDEDFDLDNPDNILEDDFVLQANEGEDFSEHEDNEDGTEHYIDSDECVMSDVGSDDDFHDQFEPEETKSRFTQFSMTSSVLPRSEHQRHLDEKFEKFFEAYDDENIGDLSHLDIDGVVPVNDISQQETIRKFLGLEKTIEEKEEKLSKPVATRQTAILENSEGDAVEDDGYSEGLESDDNELMMEIVKEVPKENWDCESILSTYSNIYNHPKIIDDIPKPIKLSKKTGIPLDTLHNKGLTAKQLHILDQQNEKEDRRTRMESECSNMTFESANVRRKGETKEEKAARKQAVKELRRERRAEKKATKIAFRQEKTRQHKEILNVQRNLTGIKLS